MPTLIVQMGHCYRKTGATGTAGEQQFATAVADACVRLLHGAGGWAVRRILADEGSASYRGDAFVAVHCDGSTSPAARGASVGYRTPEGQALGQAWKRAYAARGWPGFRQDNYTAALSGYYGTGTAVAQGNRRAVIIECGFLTSPDDRALLTGPGGVDRVALAIGDALGITAGQPIEEDDMAGQLADDEITFARQRLAGTGRRLADYWLDAAVWGQRNNVMLAQITAAVADGDLDPDAVLTRVDTAVREATQQAIADAVLPALRGVLDEVLGDDNAEQADAIVTELAERLRPAA
jgi:hypothetical protein